MLKINDLSISVKTNSFLSKRKQILFDLDIYVPSNSITAIIGANGAGKSTLIKSILGFIEPANGTIEITPKITIGFLPENPYYYDHLTLRELLWFSASSFKLSATTFEKNLTIITKQVGMHDYLDLQLRNFSKGMTQRAGIAASLIHDPDFVILDEPMSGLDPHGRSMVFNLIQSLKEKGKTVLFCSHILTDVERLCDNVIILDNGRVIKTLDKSYFQLNTKFDNNQSYLEELFKDLTKKKEVELCGQ